MMGDSSISLSKLLNSFLLILNISYFYWYFIEAVDGDLLGISKIRQRADINTNIPQ